MRLSQLLFFALVPVVMIGLAGCSNKTPISSSYSKTQIKKRPYMFGWPDFEEKVSIRGGTTKGGPVTLATEESELWKKLQDGNLSGKERDQAAIRALSGDYKASFDFMETLVFKDDKGPSSPYRSWGTERVYVVEDRPGFINLQHVMVMFFIDEKGETQGPMVMKHWRQQWEYEPENMHVYVGNRIWENKKLSEAQRKGNWVQTAFQVDDTPRYSLIGKWDHHASHSSWSSENGLRPLPRREYSVRSDYQILEGTNRITVTPTGWVHEQDNLKKVLNSDGKHDLKTPYVAREIGINRYKNLKDFDFSAGDLYWNKTAKYWALVRAEWAQRVQKNERLKVEKKCKGTHAFMIFFGLSADVETGKLTDEAEMKKKIKSSFDCIISTVSVEKDNTQENEGAK